MGPRPKRVPVTFIPAEPQKPATPQPPVPQPAPPQPAPEQPSPPPAPILAPPIQPPPLVVNEPSPPVQSRPVIPVEPLEPETPEAPESTSPPIKDDGKSVSTASKFHWLWNVFVAVMLALLVGITYSNSFQSLWTLDNKYIIQLDPRNKLATYDNFTLVWTQDYWWPKGISGLFRPIPTLSYLLNWAEPFSWDSPAPVITWAPPDKGRSPAAYKKWRDQVRQVASFDPENDPQKLQRIQNALARLQGGSISWTPPDRSNAAAFEQWRAQMKALLDVDPDIDTSVTKWMASIADRRLNPDRKDFPDNKPYDSWRGLVAKIAQFDPATEPDKYLFVQRMRAGEMFNWTPPDAQADPDTYQLWRGWVQAVGGFDPEIDRESLALVQKIIEKKVDVNVPDRETDLRNFSRFEQNLASAAGLNPQTDQKQLLMLEQVARCEQYRGKPFSWDNSGKEKGTPAYEEWKNASKLVGGFDPDTDAGRLNLVRVCQGGRGAGVRAVEWCLSWMPRGNGPRIDGSHSRDADQVIGFHWVNLIFHWLNVVLVYFLTLRIAKRFWVAVFTAAIFGVHPIGTESITNIIGRADLFATFSVLSVTLLYIRQAEKTGWRRVGLLFVMVIAMLFGLFSKESSFAVIAVVFLYDLAMRCSMKIFKLNPLGIIPMFVVSLITLAVPILHFKLTQNPDANKPETVWPFVGLFIGTMGVLIARLIYLAMPKDSVINRIVSLSLLAVMTILMGMAYTPAFWMLPLLAVIDEVVVGTALSAFVPAMRDWAEAARPFINWTVPYLLMIPPTITMFVVRHYVFFTSTPPEEPFLDNPLRGIGFFRSRMTAVYVMARQIWLLICPVNLSSDYSFDELPLFKWDFTRGSTYATVILLFVFIAIVLGAAVLRAWKNKKAICFFVFLFFLNYGPTGNFLLLIGSIMAERFMYLPLIGFAGLVVLGVDAIAKRFRVPLDVESDENPTTAPWWRWAPHALIAITIVAAGTRAYYRNLVWHEDLTLWEDAITKSPRSFRCYQSLAFALFEKIGAVTPESLHSKTTEKLLNRMIQLDETGLTLVDRLPDEKNSSRLYLHLGMYYTLKGDSVATLGSDGQLVPTDDAKKWYEKAAYILERGSRVDRTFNGVNRARDVARGKAKSEDEVADVGLSPVYSYMGMAYIKSGKLDEALQAFRYALHLDPNDADSYIKLAQVWLMKNQPGRATVPLLQAIVINDSRMDAWQMLAQIYNATNANSQIPPFQMVDGKPRLLLQNDQVKGDLYSAYLDFTRAFVLAKREDMAKQSALVAKTAYQFPSSQFDAIFRDPGPRPTPPDPVFYKPKEQPPAIEP